MKSKIERIWEGPEAVGEVAKGNPIVSFDGREVVFPTGGPAEGPEQTAEFGVAAVPAEVLVSFSKDAGVCRRCADWAMAGQAWEPVDSDGLLEKLSGSYETWYRDGAAAVDATGAADEETERLIAAVEGIADELRSIRQFGIISR